MCVRVCVCMCVCECVCVCARVCVCMCLCVDRYNYYVEVKLLYFSVRGCMYIVHVHTLSLMSALYCRLGFYCVVKTLCFQVSKAYCVSNDRVIAYAHTHKHTVTHTYTQTHCHTHTQTRTHTHTHTHTNTHTHETTNLFYTCKRKMRLELCSYM